VPGDFYELTFDLQPDDQILPAGQRLGLMIFSSDREFTLWPKPGTELTVDLAATSLELPVVGGEAAFEGAIQE
jgi:X-Pro dipeptidyl-peptidase